MLSPSLHSQQVLRYTYKAITATTATTTNNFNRPTHIRTFSTATMSKILTVFGATGIQGGSVINAVLASPNLSKTFKIRGITRDPSKPSGQALAAKGVEPVKADM